MEVPARGEPALPAVGAAQLLDGLLNERAVGGAALLAFGPGEADCASETDPRRVGAFAQSMGATAVLYPLGAHSRDLLAAAVGLSPPDSELILSLQLDDRYRPHDALLIVDEAELVNS